ncbi:DUF3265 domain-containing protein [Vibrio diabolicus]|nr:DUF3265 domain-containing protein [Vibrio diabolicus]
MEQFCTFFFKPTCVLWLISSLVVVHLALVFYVIVFVLYFNILVCFKSFKGSVLTNNSSVIQHAWHFWYAVVFGVEVPCGSLGIACFTP